jgi:hypothetical protein
MANRNFASAGKLYSGHVKPVLLDCNFVVDSTNGNGLGIRNLKGPYVQNVFMHTTATPGAGNSSLASPGQPVINPNPAAGTIVIQMQDGYNRVYSGGNSIVSPLGTPVTALTAGVAYAITSLGTATHAQWVAAGMPSGLVPALGLPFIAAASATIGGAATAAPTAAAGSGIATIETVGDGNQSIAPQNFPGFTQGFGAQFIVQCRNYSDALAAPADGSVISLTFLLSDSSVLVGNE